MEVIFLTLEFNDRKFMEANWFGQVNFKKSCSDNEYYSLYDYKHVWIYNSRIIWISRLTKQQCKIEIFANEPKEVYFTILYRRQ